MLHGLDEGQDELRDTNSPCIEMASSKSVINCTCLVESIPKCRAKVVGKWYRTSMMRYR